MNSTRTRGLGVVLTLVIAHGALSVLTESPRGRDGREDGRSSGMADRAFLRTLRLDLYPLLRLRLFIFLNITVRLFSCGRSGGNPLLRLPPFESYSTPNRDVVSAASNDGFSRPNF